jgi:hypothetical protein
MLVQHQRYGIVLSILYGTRCRDGRTGRYALRKDDLRLFIKGNVLPHWYSSWIDTYHQVGEVFLFCVQYKNEKRGTYAVVSTTLVDRWKRMRVRGRFEALAGDLEAGIANAANIIKRRYSDLDIRQSEGLMFTGTELARLIGRSLTYRDVNGFLDGQAKVIQLLADALASPKSAKPHLRLFVDWEPYDEGMRGHRFSSSNLMFASVDAVLVDAWRRPLDELRDLINTMGRVLDFSFDREDAGAAVPPSDPKKPGGRPPALRLDELSQLISRDGAASNAALARKLHVSRQTVMRARKRISAPESSPGRTTA